MKTYEEFLAHKAKQAPQVGIPNPNELNPKLKEFQHDIVNWSLKRGRSALFAGTGLGKTFMQLEWAKHIHDETKKPVLIFSPLAVAAQTVREGHKFDIDAVHVEKGNDAPIQVTNYQKIEHFDLSRYGGVVLDESSILKNHTGHFRNRLIEECKQIYYRLAATATPSPNDYMELGNHSEFTGIMSYTDMLSTFFVHDAAKTQDWRLKGHAEDKFWQWMASWSVMLQSPADLGYDGSEYALPKLHQIQHTVKAEYVGDMDAGLLFPMEARSMSERLKVRRDTIEDRVNKAAEIVNNEKHTPWVVWCNLNDESAMLTNQIEDAVEVKGSGMSEAKKEQILEDFANGKIRVLVTKPSICGMGMNWQHCNHTCFVGLNDSFEQLYQAIRRFWRFGQEKEVYAHFIASELEGAVVQNIKRKEEQAQHMMNMMVKHMADLNADEIHGAMRDTTGYAPQETIKIPTWMKG